MKLYFSKDACSLAPHIVAREAGIAIELLAVDLARATLVRDGASFLTLTGKGQVPVLDTGTGELLTEGPIICQYLADHAGARSLMPAAGSTARYRVMEWQNFITSDLHKTYSVLFSRVSGEAKACFSDVLHTKYRWVDSALQDACFLTGEEFTAADAYLFVVTRWADVVGVDLGGYHHLQAFMRRVGQRPAVREALRLEALHA